MRRILALVIALVLCGICCVAAETLPTVDQALAMGTGNRVEVLFDLPAVDIDATEDFDISGLSIIILERRAPEKEFTGFDSGYPDNYVTDFPDDFEGVDLGEMKTYLRLDLMKALPDWMRAPSVQDADFIYIVEGQYHWVGTISITAFEGGSDDVPEYEFETLEELEAYNEAHPKRISSITYYPKFDHMVLGYLYEPATGRNMLMDVDISEARRFARNTVCSDIASNMVEIEMYAYVLPELCADYSAEDVCDYLTVELYFAPEEKVDFWCNCISQGEVEAAASSMMAYYWTLAEEIIENDPEESHKASLTTAMQAKDSEFFSALVDVYNYAGFDTPIEEIKRAKTYMGSADNSMFDALFTEFIEILAE